MAANREFAGVSEPGPAQGAVRERRFVDWAAHVSVSKVRAPAHLGLCCPAHSQPEADRSLSGTDHSPETSRDLQRTSVQPTNTNLSRL